MIESGFFRKLNTVMTRPNNQITGHGSDLKVVLGRNSSPLPLLNRRLCFKRTPLMAEELHCNDMPYSVFLKIFDKSFSSYDLSELRETLGYIPIYRRAAVGSRVLKSLCTLNRGNAKPQTGIWRGETLTDYTGPIDRSLIDESPFRWSCNQDGRDCVGAKHRFVKRPEAIHQNNSDA